MSLYDYERSKDVAGLDAPFDSLIMAAMRKADDRNLANLRAMFPAIHDEVARRYNAPGGRLEGEL